MQNTILEDIAAEIGYTATAALTAWYGGRWMRVPVAADKEHVLAKLLGLPAYTRLVGAFADQRLFIPKDSRQALRRQRQVYNMLSHGMSPQRAAEVLSITAAQVHNIRRELEEAGLLPTILKTPPVEQPHAEDDGAC